MERTAARLARWSPTMAGILVSLLIGMFALDAFSEGKPFVQALPDFVMHLIPAFVLLAIVGASVRRPWLGAITFISLGVLYALTMSKGRLDWMLAISSPLIVVGALFLWNWVLDRRPA